MVADNQPQDFQDSDEDHIAVIGVSGRYPQSPDISAFWNNLKNGKDCIADITDEDLTELGIPASVYNRPDFVRRGTKMPFADRFDARFFGFIPREAIALDPQCRVFLETCYEALENSGYDPFSYNDPIGLFAGSGANDYATLSDAADPSDTTTVFEQLIGAEKDFLATRVSHRLNLTGPSMTVQTACSTSLVAIHMAVQSLLSNECTMCLAGGVAISFRTSAGYVYQEGMILSPDGVCRAFDSKASGTTLGQGCGVVLLKRLSDALEDNDHIYAVIRGSAINNDGNDKIGYTAPSENGQAEVITLSQQLADVESDTIGYVETHGTGTKMGDPIEITALSRAFAPGTERTGYCAIGSVKTNFGHTDTAAGVTGFIKAMLSLYHKEIVPSLHYESANPAIDFDSTPFYVNTKLTPWESPSGPRRAGVSSFGIGGTNAHLVLEEAPARQMSADVTRPQLLPLSAKTSEALELMVANLNQHLAENPTTRIGDVAFTLRYGRPSYEHRAAVLAWPLSADAESPSLRQVNSTRWQTTSQGSKLIWMFSGQGAQYAEMCAGLYQVDPDFTRAVDQCASLFEPLLNEDIRNLIFTKENNNKGDRLSQTAYTQPALFTIEYSLSQMLHAWGLQADAVIGHSIGEFAAAVEAGILSLEDAVTVVYQRGQLMQSMQSGAMLSVNMAVNDLKQILPTGLEISVESSPEMNVVSGPLNLINEFRKTLEERDETTHRVDTSHAFHSAMMAEAATAFESVMQGVTLLPPSLPMTSNVSGLWLTDEQATDPKYWASQIISTVKFSSCISTSSKIGNDHAGNIAYLEVGPGKTLSSLVKFNHDVDPGKSLVTNMSRHCDAQESDYETALQAAGALWSAGFALSWAALEEGQDFSRIPLPTYPFARDRYWGPKHKQLLALPQFEESSEHPTDTVSTDLQTQNTVAAPLSTPSTILSTSTERQMTRREFLISELKITLLDISGIAASQIADDSTFVELGFDSLFLTQFSGALKKKFKTPITIRQLSETTPTINAIADFLDNELDPNQFKPPSAAAELATSDRSADDFSEINASTINKQSELGPSESNKNLISVQLSLISQQIELLAQASNLRAAPMTQTSPPANIVSTAGFTSDTGNATPESGPTVKSLTAEKHGPWKQINVSSNNAISAANKAGLDELIPAYVGKTKQSKAHTEKFRTQYADPRSIAGFNRFWKEIVYSLVANHGSGSRIWDIDGNEYIDVQSGFGSVFFGHNTPFIRDAVAQQLDSGMLIGPQYLLAGSVAADICEVTGMDRATYCNTGSEAVLAALRVSRTVTGNDKIVMFAQDYHGIFDEVVSRRVGPMEKLRSLPAAPGIPDVAVENIVILEYGDPACFQILEDIKDDLAAILVEPVQSRRPGLQPKEFLISLREWTRKNSVALIFDEVITGFRLHPRGAQGWYEIDADLCTYGKIIGGGMPIGILAGQRKFMDSLDGGSWNYGDDTVPEVGVTYFAGTFVRHPLAVVAADATIQTIKQDGTAPYDDLNNKCEQFAYDLNSQFKHLNLPIHLQNCGSMMFLEFLTDSIYNPLFFYYLRLNNVFISDNGSFFMTLAHTEEEFDTIKLKFTQSAEWMQKYKFLSDE